VHPLSADTELCFASAVDLADGIRSRRFSCVEVMQAHLDRIEALDPGLNAIVTFLPERGLEGARRADAAVARGEALGPLHGLPVAHKDLVMTAGIRTTQGSKLFEHRVPDQDDLIVERIREAGAICIGKTNTPEFGAGSQTFNEVFGETRNPWDPTKTCGGSSGGAAVALASGMLPIADGSDMGGSLRNPASFCNVVGLRPSPGRVPVYPAQLAGSGLSVQGPMARSAADAALLLSAIAGPDARSPISLGDDGARFGWPLDRDFSGVRIAWSPSLGGLLPVDSRVSAALEAAVPALRELGCEVEPAEPDLSGADEVFQVLRAWSFAMGFEAAPPEALEVVKDTVRWNVERGRALSGLDVGRAEASRTGIYHRMREFMADFDFLALPVSQVPPFPIEERWVREIDGEKMETYIDWMKSCYFITVTGHPAISVPCGFTGGGTGDREGGERALPVGLQLVGRHRDDWGVLQLAHAFEQVLPTGRRRPGLQPSSA
jgi:amidase